MNDTTVKPWTRLDCSECGMDFQFTRTEPKPQEDRPLCGECQAYERGYADGQADRKFSNNKAFWETVRSAAEQAKTFSETRLRQLGDEWLDSPRDISIKEPKQ